MMRLATLYLLLSSSEAFIIPKKCVLSNNLCFVATNNDEDKPKRKQRFAQDAHAARPRRTRTVKTPVSGPLLSSSGAEKVRSASYPTKATSNRKPLGRRSLPSPTQVNDELMWRTGKSIDDIEANMAKRWGTELGKWAADPNEYELEDGDQDDNFQSQQTFRGKPVLDPWQKEELKARPRDQTTPVVDQAGAFASTSDEEMILNMARRNQLQPRPATRSRKLSWGDLVQDVEPLDEVNEFYDEDDEGFEEKNDSNSGAYNYDVGKLISPKPVGSLGSKNAAPTKLGYFFNSNTGGEDEVVVASSELSTPKQSSKSQVPSSLLGEDGNPLFLTLAQAELNFRDSIVSHTSSQFEVSPVSTDSTAWNQLGVTSKRLLQNLQSMGCEAPLSVQKKSCPPILTGNDVLVGTYTGSGKTLAFLVPLVQRLLFEAPSSGDGIQILILAPGRELASQIANVARSLVEGTGLSIVLAIGGTTFSRNLEQIRKRKPTIIVGTPGRIAELVVGQPGEKIGRMKISSIQTVVFDEFDALLEYKPHRDPTAAIMSALKRRHRDSLQSILCSATATDMIGSAKLSSYLRPGYFTAMADNDDELITSGDDSNAVTRVSRTVIHGVVHVSRRQLALSTIRKILHTEPVPQQVLIFADNARRVDLVVEKLAQIGIVAAPLHGGNNSEKMDRAEVSKALREGYVGIVVATELAARGIDAPLLTHVINLDLPTDASHYAHRAGRCGRGGRPGVVINITTGPKERSVPKKLSDKLGVKMFTVDPRSGRLAIVDPMTVILDE